MIKRCPSPTTGSRLSSLTCSFVGLVLPLCFIGSCTLGAPPEPLRQGGATGLQYRSLVRDKTGKHRLGSPNGPGEVTVYVFSVHVNDIRAFGHEDLLSARRMLEAKRSVPSECSGRYRVTEIGRIEGGIRTISVECDEDDKAPSKREK